MMNDKNIEFQALITEREGMLADNAVMEYGDLAPSWGADSFFVIAEKMRALKEGE